MANERLAAAAGSSAFALVVVSALACGVPFTTGFRRGVLAAVIAFAASLAAATTIAARRNRSGQKNTDQGDR